MNRIATPIIIFLVIIVSINAHAWPGKVTGVTDGDTIKVLFQGIEVKVRLYGIDTPEKKQAFGNEAKKMTNTLLRGRNVKIYPKGKDRYGRTIGLVIANGVNVNETLIRNGYAWVYRKYCKEKFCAEWYQYEKYARSNKKGMWVDPHIVPPWEWRHQNKKKKQTSSQTVTQRWNSYHPTPPARARKKYSASGKYHGNVKSHKFHRPGCRVYNCKNCTAGFSSRAAAISSGYTPCGICKP